jgi:hypothetical protein
VALKSERLQRLGLRRMLRNPAFEVGLITDQTNHRQALALEQRVWYQESYGDLAVYEKYLPQSRIFVAYKDGNVVGMNRLIDGAPALPPFLTEMPIEDQTLAGNLISEAAKYKVEEFGTVAIEKEFRGGRLFLDLCRLAYRDAAERGIQTWGIIMEPERVQKMNSGLGFTFKQIGPTVDYQGGMCAAHIMDFAEVRHNMSTTKPELYDWFVNQPLGR